MLAHRTPPFVPVSTVFADMVDVTVSEPTVETQEVR
jgi:hypothetical protein